jgi:hypothetical protein
MMAPLNEDTLAHNGTRLGKLLSKFAPSFEAKSAFRDAD